MLLLLKCNFCFEGNSISKRHEMSMRQAAQGVNDFSGIFRKYECFIGNQNYCDKWTIYENYIFQHMSNNFWKYWLIFF